MTRQNSLKSDEDATPTKLPPAEEAFTPESEVNPDGRGDDDTARELNFQVKKRPFQTWQTRYNRAHADHEKEMEKKDKIIHNHEWEETQVEIKMIELQKKLDVAVQEREALETQLKEKEKEVALAVLTAQQKLQKSLDHSLDQRDALRVRLKDMERERARTNMKLLHYTEFPADE